MRWGGSPGGRETERERVARPWIMSCEDLATCQAFNTNTGGISRADVDWELQSLEMTAFVRGPPARGNSGKTFLPLRHRIHILSITNSPLSRQFGVLNPSSIARTIGGFLSSRKGLPVGARAVDPRFDESPTQPVSDDVRQMNAALMAAMEEKVGAIEEIEEPKARLANSPGACAWRVCGVDDSFVNPRSGCRSAPPSRPRRCK